MTLTKHLPLLQITYGLQGRLEWPHQLRIGALPLHTLNICPHCVPVPPTVIVAVPVPVAVPLSIALPVAPLPAQQCDTLQKHNRAGLKCGSKALSQSQTPSGNTPGVFAPFFPCTLLLASLCVPLFIIIPI